MVTASD